MWGNAAIHTLKIMPFFSEMMIQIFLLVPTYAWDSVFKIKDFPPSALGMYFSIALTLNANVADVSWI